MAFHRALPLLAIGLVGLPLSGCITSVYLVEAAFNSADDTLSALSGFPEEEAGRMESLPLSALAARKPAEAAAYGVDPDTYRKWRDYELGRRYETGEGGASRNLTCAHYFFNNARVSAGTWSDNQNGFDFIWAKKAVERLRQAGVPLGDPTCDRGVREDVARSGNSPESRAD